MEPIYIILIVAGVFAFVVLMIVVAVVAERKRTEAIQKAALELGFEFQKDGGGLSHLLRSFELMNRGRGRRFRNVVRRTADGKTVHLCDYQYTTSGGKNSTTHRQSIAIIESDELNLPSFSLSPESFLHRFAEMLGMQDIDFEEAPEFSRKFVLRGSDEPAIREFFTLEMLEQLPEFGPINVAGEGPLLMIWFSRRVKPAEVRQFFETAFRVHLLLCR